jgi:hypothetical protein
MESNSWDFGSVFKIKQEITSVMKLPFRALLVAK